MENMLDFLKEMELHLNRCIRNFLDKDDSRGMANLQVAVERISNEIKAHDLEG